MRRFALPFVILAAVFVAAALAWITLTRVSGAGGNEMTTEIRVVDPFDRVEINGRADVTLVQGDKEAVTVEAAARGQSRADLPWSGADRPAASYSASLINEVVASAIARSRSSRASSILAESSSMRVTMRRCSGSGGTRTSVWSRASRGIVDWLTQCLH